MYKTILISGAILFGGLYLSCASGTAKNADAPPAKQPPVVTSPDKPHPDIPPVIMPQEQTNEARQAATSKAIETLMSLKLPELYTKYVDLKTMEIMDYNTMVSKLKGIQVVYVAEAHTNEAHHKLQGDILKSLSQKNPKTAMAMEFLYRSKQESIDNYTADKITEEEFDKTNTFGFGEWYHYYLALVRYAHDNKIKLIGMNVEKDIKRKMANMGWDKLTPEEQKLIAKDVDTSNEKHKEFVMKQFSGMMSNPQTRDMMKGPMIDKMYLMQCMWDETFAESIANYLKAANDPAVQVVVVAGSGHIEYKFNIPDRSYKRFPAPFKTLVPFEVDENTPAAYLKEELSSGAGDFGYFSPLSPRGDNLELPFGRK
ncbi:MAG TPA: ChaN family lipoprotein [Planctomycetota bacterium]|nr:ChaN family lipoprotein [Planctomycetota bacterium]